MKYSKGRKILAGVLTASILCVCVGCGKEEDRQSAKQTETQEATENRAEAAKEETENSEKIEQTDSQEVGDTGETNVDEAFSLEGVTVSIYGDSISTFEGWIPYGYNNFYPESGDVKDINDIWWARVFDDTGMKLCTNASSSGCICAGDSTDVENPQVGCSDFRITDLSDQNGVYPDIIIIFMGTNDLLNGIPLGENDGTVVVEEGIIDNFADAYSLMLDKLETYYPCSEIYCCTLLQVGDYGTETPYVALTNGLALTAEDYSAQIRLIAENKGYPVIDLYHCGIEIGNLQNMTSDGVHPNVEGMKYIAEAVTSTITDARSRRQ